jgi:hypothetical protein
LCESLRVEGKVVVVIFWVLVVDIGALRRSSSWRINLGMEGIMIVIIVVVVVVLVLLDKVGVGGAILRLSPFARRRNQALMFASPKVIRSPYEKKAQGEGNPPSMR